MVAALLLCACGKQYKAEDTVKAFLDINLKSGNYDVSFTKIDSTKLISDSIVNVMRIGECLVFLSDSQLLEDNTITE